MDANGNRMNDGGSARDGKRSREELQASARALIDDLRRKQEPPEQILLHIKQFLAEAGLRSGFPSGQGPAASERDLYRDIITWSIRYYYDGDGKAG